MGEDISLVIVREHAYTAIFTTICRRKNMLLSLFCSKQKLRVFGSHKYPQFMYKRQMISILVVPSFTPVDQVLDSMMTPT